MMKQLGGQQERKNEAHVLGFLTVASQEKQTQWVTFKFFASRFVCHGSSKESCL